MGNEKAGVTAGQYENEMQAAFEATLMRAYLDIAEGRHFESSGDFKTDMAMWKQKRADGWA